MLQHADDRAVPGLDRVLWVRVRLHDGQPVTGVAHGIRHRHPVDVPIPPGVVARLLRCGVPAVRVGA